MEGKTLESVLFDKTQKFFAISVNEQTLIRSKNSPSWFTLDGFQHASFRHGPQYSMIWKVDPAEKIDAGGDRPQFNLVWMKPEAQLAPEKIRDHGQKAFQILALI